MFTRKGGGGAALGPVLQLYIVVQRRGGGGSDPPPTPDPHMICIRSIYMDAYINDVKNMKLLFIRIYWLGDFSYAPPPNAILLSY